MKHQRHCALRAWATTCLAGLLMWATGCGEQPPTAYQEHRPSFSELRHGDWTANQWVRKPENLLMLHESFKQFGYFKLLDQVHQGAGEFLIGPVYVRKNFRQWADSLEASFADPEAFGTYYREFWERRREEGNDSAVHLILREFNDLTHRGRMLPSRPGRVNDTLAALLNLEFGTGAWIEERALSAFGQLKAFGMHQSAYNLLYERPETAGLGWNRDSLEQTLRPLKAGTSGYPWLADLEK
ncbi:hypothetical protein [Robiginitalea sediminis]|uniref:hypothetical protein n=1 Tax=Robiginitalea sediminis TaxID=1982593 RepID=UPI000B4BCA58|nr:hypothetical protein [Robiginitalea sediminis]